MRTVRKQVVLRNLGAAERWFWFMNQNRPLHFLLAASFHGAQPEEQWAKAIKIVGARHPMLRVEVIQEDGELVFVEVEPRVSFHCIRRENDLHCKDVSEKQLNTPFTSQTDALMRVMLLQGDDRCDLILCFHHSIADAVSAMHLIHEILQTLNGAEFNSYTLPKSMDSLIAEYLESALAPAQGEPSQNWPVAFRDQSKKAIVEIRTLSSDQTKRLRELARKHGVTVGHSISAAFTLAGQQLSEVWRKLPVRIFLPIDLAADCNYQMR